MSITVDFWRNKDVYIISRLECCESRRWVLVKRRVCDAYIRRNEWSLQAISLVTYFRHSCTFFHINTYTLLCLYFALYCHVTYLLGHATLFEVDLSIVAAGRVQWNIFPCNHYRLPAAGI